MNSLTDKRRDDVGLILTNNCKNDPRDYLDLILSNNLTINYIMKTAHTYVTETDVVTKKEFEKVQKSIAAGRIDYIVNEKEPIEVLSLFRPFSYKPRFFMSKFENSVLPKNVVTEVFKNYVKEANADITAMFNWLIQSMSVINFNLINGNITAKGDTITNETGTKEAWIKIVHKTPILNENREIGRTYPSYTYTYTYPALMKIDGKYLICYRNGQAFLNDKDTYVTDQINLLPEQTNTEEDQVSLPLEVKTFTKEEMENIIIDNLVIEFHYLQYGNVTYDDKSEISVKEKPYFYPPYGLNSSFTYNLTLNTTRTKIMGETKRVSTSFVSRYYYCYFHLCGVYFYKAFIRKEEYKIDAVGEGYFPYINKDFYKNRISYNCLITDNAQHVQLETEKEESIQQGFQYY